MLLLLLLLPHGGTIGRLASFPNQSDLLNLTLL
jgi:hypothetical protein